MTIKQYFRHIPFSIAACRVLTLSLLSSSCREQTASESMNRLDYMAVQIDENDSWSIMDNSGKIIIEREYSPKGSISKIYPNGLFWVRQNEKNSLFSIESYKKAINTQEYDQVTDFVDGRAFASVIGEPKAKTQPYRMLCWHTAITRAKAELCRIRNSPTKMPTRQ